MMATELSETDIFALLSERRRRLVLRVIQESGTPLPVTQLADRIGERERGTPSAEELQDLERDLRRNHIPRLEAYDVVRYDEMAGTVSPGMNFDPPVRFLAESREEDLSWSDA